ncbi:hypothetical protein B0H17DRAFT_1136124 [Mycena rosella]|uniref:Uncharacterized protein n=1 Tax=Mycena rosella TaxID=1033263 RepID=A0AAD7GC94_MYCRO|nr:hypothetical protein B0H17DRAFT_1136124 [Mycena rosella]
MGGESNSRKRKRDSTVDPPETPEVSVAPVIYKCRFNVPNEPTKVWYATGFQRVEEASRADRYTLVFVRDKRYKHLADKLTPVLATEDDRRRYDSEWPRNKTSLLGHDGLFAHVRKENNLVKIIMSLIKEHRTRKRSAKNT